MNRTVKSFCHQPASASLSAHMFFMLQGKVQITHLEHALEERAMGQQEAGELQTKSSQMKVVLNKVDFDTSAQKLRTLYVWKISCNTRHLWMHSTFKRSLSIKSPRLLHSVPRKKSRCTNEVPLMIRVTILIVFEAGADSKFISKSNVISSC